MCDFQWSKCVICQTKTCESLRCPTKAYSFHKDVYSVFLKNVAEFSRLDALPTKLTFNIETTTDNELVEKEAKWHRSCHLKFSSSKLNKVQERQNVSSAEPAEPQCTSRTSKRKQGTAVDSFENICIFCEKSEDNGSLGSLHRFSTVESDKNLRRIVSDLKDYELLTKISGIGDLVAIEAKYHMKCLTNVRNKHKIMMRKSKKIELVEAEEAEKINEARAFLELTDYIESSVENGTHFFVVAELHTLYEGRLRDLGVEKSINRFRLKNELMTYFPESQEESDGRRTVLAFKEGLTNILNDAVKERDLSDDTKILAKAAKILRRDIFSHSQFKFDGSFPVDCQESSVPASLKSLISMTLNGLNLKDQEHNEAQPCLTICQSILFNAKKRGSNQKQVRHSTQREPPLPIYLGLSIHASIRSKTLISKLYQLGLSISYDRVMDIEDLVAKSISERSVEEGCVAPLLLKKKLFSVGALDNLDHNTSSTTSMSSFHGTGISIFQFPTEDNPGENRQPIAALDSELQTHALPDSYTIVPPTELKTTSMKVPPCNQQPVDSCIADNKICEDRWIENALQIITDTNDLTTEHAITWAAYHSKNQSAEKDPPAISALLPLFYEKAATPAMIKHGMDVLKQTINFINPHQIPVIALDQPLFAIAKMVQWKWPQTHGEDKYVVMFGGLHLEMALWNTLGDLLESSGWSTALTEAEVASSGVAESFTKASHLTRTRYFLFLYIYLLS